VALDDLRSVGILGGTFNPPHLGHLAIACHARDELGLGLVLLMPSQTPPHKPIADPGSEHRLRMCRLLVEDVGRLRVCPLELERRGPSYTVNTLKVIRASHPDVELTFIVGADTARTLPAWREPAKLLELADLAVAARAGTARREVLDAVAPLGASAGVRFLEAPVMEISSSIARGRVARGEPIDDLVGPAVARYVTEHGLYRSGTEASS
jgi:nicotinate-nucleotide adenylyltransferase